MTPQAWTLPQVVGLWVVEEEGGVLQGTAPLMVAVGLVVVVGGVLLWTVPQMVAVGLVEVVVMAARATTMTFPLPYPRPGSHVSAPPKEPL